MRAALKIGLRVATAFNSSKSRPIRFESPPLTGRRRGTYRGKVPKVFRTHRVERGRRSVLARANAPNVKSGQTERIVLAHVRRGRQQTEIQEAFVNPFRHVPGVPAARAMTRERMFAREIHRSAAGKYHDTLNSAVTLPVRH
jgi:hypothetical protein